MKFKLRELPVIQNWSCHRCGNCCREYYVTVTEEERRRIEGQGWSERPEFQSQPLFVKVGPLWRREYRLAHRPDGSCIFLNQDGLCRIHAEYGEQAKPVVCQFYPFMLAPAGNELRVSVRFSCPSAVKNLGKPLPERAEELRGYAQALIPPGAQPPKPPMLSDGQEVDWSQLLQVTHSLESIITGAGSELPLRMIQAISFARTLEKARVAQLSKADFGMLLDILATESVKVGAEGSEAPCRGWACVLFRLIVAQCSRKDLSPHLRRGLRGRWGLLRAATRFALGRGRVPQLQPIFGNVDFASIERPFGPIAPEAWQILERYYRIKLSGIQFFGGSFFQVPLIEGFYSLALTLPAILWIARWLARTAGRESLRTDDIVQALTVLDHQWGFAGTFGFAYSRARVRLLASEGQIARLIWRYAR